MNTKLVQSLAAGVLGVALLGTDAIAQQGGSGSSQTSGQQGQTSGSGGTTTTGTETGTTTRSTGGAMTSSGLPGTSNTPAGLNLQGMQFGTGSGTGGTQGTGTTGRGGRGTIGGRTSTSSFGQGAGGLGGLGAGGAGRGGTSSSQMNRQAERRAQVVTQLDQRSFAPAVSEPGSTLVLRSTVEQSVAAVSSAAIRVSMDGSTAVLSGPVSSAHESKLAERMALLEPGVRAVRNELVVSPSPANP